MNRSIAALAGAALLLTMASGVAAQGLPLGSPIPQKPLGKAMDGESSTAFAANQLTFARVARARQAREGELKLLFSDRGIPYPAPEIFLRVFKHERVLELWVRSRGDSAFTLLKEYPVCALPGQLGPKRRMGDVQVPEGFYFIDDFNPNSSFHLSLRVNYPNMADRMRRQALALGGDIFIHGGCETVGCVPIENDNIEEVYWLAVQAMDAGQKIIPVHIFPTRLEPDRIEWLRRNFDPEPELLEFWKGLVDGYAYFEQTQRVPWVTVGETGEYVVPDRPRLAAGDAPAGTAETRDAGAEDAGAGAAETGDAAAGDAEARGARTRARSGATSGATSGVSAGPSGDARAPATPPAPPGSTTAIPADSPGSPPATPPTAPADSTSRPDTARADTAGPAIPGDTVPPDSLLPRGTIPRDTVPAPDSVPAGKAPKGKDPAGGTPAGEAPAEKAPAEKAPSEKAPAEKVPAPKPADPDTLPVLPGRPVSVPPDSSGTSGTSGGA